AIDLADGSVAGILRLANPVAAATGDRFVLRRAGRAIDAIVGGVVLDAAPARGVSRRRQTPDRVARLHRAVHARDGRSIEAAGLAFPGATGAGAGEVWLAPDAADAVGSAVLQAVVIDPTVTGARIAATRSLRRVVTIDRSGATLAARAVVDGLVESGRLVAEGASLRPAGAAATA